MDLFQNDFAKRLASIAYILDTITKCAIPNPSPKIFEKLINYLTIEHSLRSNINISHTINQVFHTWLNCYDHKQDVSTWLQFLNWLKRNRPQEVSAQYQNALQALDKASKVKKDLLIKGFVNIGQ